MLPSQKYVTLYYMDEIGQLQLRQQRVNRVVNFRAEFSAQVDPCNFHK